MSEIQVEVGGVDPALAELPTADGAQAAVCGQAAAASLVVRGAPGSGRTTCALMVLAQCRARGESAVLWAPDRSRVDALESRVQALLPEAVRPVRTPAAYAYQVVSTWRIGRDDRRPGGPAHPGPAGARWRRLARQHARGHACDARLPHGGPQPLRPRG